MACMKKGLDGNFSTPAISSSAPASSFCVTDRQTDTQAQTQTIIKTLSIVRQQLSVNHEGMSETTLEGVGTLTVDERTDVLKRMIDIVNIGSDDPGEQTAKTLADVK